LFFLIFYELSRVWKVEHKWASEKVVVEIAHLAARVLHSFLQQDLTSRLEKAFSIICMSTKEAHKIVEGNESQLRE
jgi:uncharacterized membrane protein